MNEFAYNAYNAFRPTNALGSITRNFPVSSEEGDKMGNTRKAKKKKKSRRKREEGGKICVTLWRIELLHDDDNVVNKLGAENRIVCDLRESEEKGKRREEKYK